MSMSSKVSRLALAQPPRRRQGGLTLIELIVFIVIISVALTGILVTFNTVVRSSADPLVLRQLQAIAEAMLEEVLLQDYQAPPGSTGGTTRADFDNIDKYHGFDSDIELPKPGIKFPNGDSVPHLDSYRVRVSVGAEADWGTPAAKAKLITVTASRSGQSFVLSGYRTQDPAP